MLRPRTKRLVSAPLEVDTLSGHLAFSTLKERLPKARLLPVPCTCRTCPGPTGTGSSTSALTFPVTRPMSAYLGHYPKPWPFVLGPKDPGLLGACSPSALTGGSLLRRCRRATDGLLRSVYPLCAALCANISETTLPWKLEYNREGGGGQNVSRQSGRGRDT